MVYVREDSASRPSPSMVSAKANVPALSPVSMSTEHHDLVANCCELAVLSYATVYFLTCSAVSHSAFRLRLGDLLTKLLVRNGTISRHLHRPVAEMLDDEDNVVRHGCRTNCSCSASHVRQSSSANF